VTPNQLAKSIIDIRERPMRRMAFFPSPVFAGCRVKVARLKRIVAAWH
jgi:hypothetical protein